MARGLAIAALLWSGMAALLGLGIFLARENLDPDELQRNDITFSLSAAALATAIGLVAAVFRRQPRLAAALAACHVALAITALTLASNNQLGGVHAWTWAIALVGEAAVIGAAVLARRA